METTPSTPNLSADSVVVPKAQDAGSPILLSRMGSFFFGGKVVRESNGDVFHGDHGYAQYFVPDASRSLPLIMWHGLGQSGKCWESTPDGRDGFWQMFTRRRWPVYIIDQPRRGRAGRAVLDPSEVETAAVPTVERESEAWNTFRLGVWHPPAPPTFFPGLQMLTDDATIDQFLRHQTPNTGLEPFPDRAHRDFMGSTVADLVARVGPSVLMTHSHAGQYGWVTAMNSPELVKAIIAIEPGEFAFPDDDPPADVATESELLASFMAPQLVPADEFAKLLDIPILIVMGDNVPREPHPDFGIELWRIVKERALQFADAVTKRGGSVTLLDLPEVGIHGNSHFPMTDLNNEQIAGLIEDFLAKHELDTVAAPYAGPYPA